MALSVRPHSSGYCPTRPDQDPDLMMPENAACADGASFRPDAAPHVGCQMHDCQSRRSLVAAGSIRLEMADNVGADQIAGFAGIHPDDLAKQGQ